MQTQLRSAIGMLALLATLIAAATALAQSDSPTGGTAAGPPAEVQDSGGVAGPQQAPQARRSQQAAQDEQPPQVETTPEEPAPDEEETVEEDAPAEPDEAPSPAAGTGAGTGGGSGGGLPTTGLEIAALTAMGLGLLLAGVVLRRYPTA